LITYKKVLSNRFRFKDKLGNKHTAHKHPYTTGIYIIYKDGCSELFNDEQVCIKHIENGNWELI